MADWDRWWASDCACVCVCVCVRERERESSESVLSALLDYYNDDDDDRISCNCSIILFEKCLHKYLNSLSDKYGNLFCLIDLNTSNNESFILEIKYSFRLSLFNGISTPYELFNAKISSTCECFIIIIIIFSIICLHSYMISSVSI